MADPLLQKWGVPEEGAAPAGVSAQPQPRKQADPLLEKWGVPASDDKVLASEPQSAVGKVLSDTVANAAALPSDLIHGRKGSALDRAGGWLNLLSGKYDDPTLSAEMMANAKKNDVIDPNRGWLDFKSDPNSQAMFKSFGAAGGAVGNSVMEAVKRIATGGKEGLGDEEWAKTLKGDATPMPEQLQKKFGMSPLASYAVGLPGAVLADPFAGAIGPLSELKPEAGLWNLIAQRTRGAADTAATGPLAAAGQMAGKKIYTSPFKKVDNYLREKFPYMRKYGNSPFTDILWNKGKPEVGGFSKANMDIVDEIEGMRKGVGAEIGEATRQAGGGELFDVAPDLNDHAKIAQLEHANASGIELDEKSPPALEWLKNELALSATVPGAAVRRSRALEVLKDATAEKVPDLAKAIDHAAKGLKNSSQKEKSLMFLHGLVDDLAEGPRTLEELKDVGTSMHAAASRNVEQGANINARRPLRNVYKESENLGGRSVGDMVTDIIAERLPEAQYPDLKRRYNIINQGEKKAATIAATAANRPLFSKLDYSLGGIDAATGNVPAAIIHAIGKFATELHRNPRLATGTGKLVNSVGGLNLWDNMLRRRMMDTGRGDK